MESNEKDYFFYINWEDSEMNKYRIGLLAKIGNYYYLKMKSKKNSSIAYQKGCIGITGFQNERVYKSEELFDFFKNRIFNTQSNNLCEELKITSARTMTDSFWVEEIPEKLSEKFKKVILDMYENQEEMNSKVISAPIL